MIEESTLVVDVTDNEITVVSQVKSSCSSCSQVDTCGSGIVAKAIPHRELKITLPYRKIKDKRPIQLGDTVVIGLPQINILMSAWQVYLYPLIGLIIFSAIGQWLIQQSILSTEFFAICLGFFGGYLGHRLAKYTQGKTEHNEKLQPQILRILPQKLPTQVIHQST